MIASEFKDIDGFRLQFEESVPDDERTYYMRTFLRVDDVAKDRVHCTTCDLHVGTAPISEKIIRTHQILGVTQCNKCFAFYNSGEFGKGEDGSEYYCRWCGQGGEVFCCSTCPFVFCNKCIKDNLTMAYIKEIERNDDWSCFVCNRETLKRLRAQHWALRNFMNKQLEKIQNVNINSEEELNTMLNDDKSSCCPKKKRKQILKPTAPAAPIKRPAMNGTGISLSGPPAKKQIIAPTKMLKVPVNTNYHLTKPGPKPQMPASFSKPRNNDEVVCTPDILGLFNNKTQSPGQRPVAATAPPPLIMRQNQRPIRPMASTNSAGNPIYHTVNGFQIDLNQAARQEIFRLPNGKLIQVRKQPNSSSSSSPQIRPGLQLQMQPRAQHIPVRPAPPTIATTSRMMRPSMTPQLRVPRPQMSQQRPTAPSAPTGPVASTVFTQQNGSISVARAPQPDTPYGKAKTAFEDKIINGLEICQHTINKMITLTNSTSFKTSRSFADLKELYIHLQYLFTYTSGKIKTLQDSLATNVEELAKHDKSLKEKEKHDADELEIVEQKQDVIEVLSDDEVDVPVKAFATKRTAPPITQVEYAPEKSLDVENEIMSAIAATMQNPFSKPVDQMELLASCGYVSEDQKLLIRSAVKVERLEDTKSPIIKQYMIAIQQRRDREPSVEHDESENMDDDDFPPLVPEIVMDENPNADGDGAEATDGNEATSEEKFDSENAQEPQVNISVESDVVEIPSEDEETVDKEKSADKEQIVNKDVDSNSPLNLDADTEESINDKIETEQSVDKKVDTEESLNENTEAEQSVNEVSKDENETVDESRNESIPSVETLNDSNEVEMNEEPAATEAQMEVDESVENPDVPINESSLNFAELLAPNQEQQEENVMSMENGNSTQANDFDLSVNDTMENNDELSKMTENGIDEKDLLDNLINSLDENEPLAPIELENFQ